ncbi:MAG TPA: valine--tRNA ligase [Patescibacteria group bacterium]|nr:valine--tRNA ligase [Patescibacteria group bacterium]
MSFTKRYFPSATEIKLQDRWSDLGINHFQPDRASRVFAIDTPPPTVSGNLHLGHVYSYSHVDFFARYLRMQGHNVLYPMGSDDNGLPTERLVERKLGIKATDVGREEFISHCLRVSAEAEQEYETLWRRLGLSIDWRYSYRTIDEYPRRLSQLSFIDLYQKKLAFRQRAPAIWCPECHTAIAQADLEDLEREGEFVTLNFMLEDGKCLPISTTRPELLPACVAVFVHPDDERFRQLIGQGVRIPLFGHRVPILADTLADPKKGSGAVMCCTFGDVTDVSWWYKYDLNLIETIGKDGRLTEAAGQLQNLTVAEARAQIKKLLTNQGFLISQEPTTQSVRVHERCDTPVEYIVTRQWFIKLLDFKQQFLDLGEQVQWFPDHMKNRYRRWVENLNWDWCISRQRYYGVTFPLWYCEACQEVMLAREEDLPVDPLRLQPDRPCSCGHNHFTPETDVMDTWATSSLTPQLVSHWLKESGFDGEEFTQVDLRPQAHEIIRTWAFYSIVKAYHHFGQIPWSAIVISGWALSPKGSGKISKSKGGGPVAPLEVIERFSADAARYWAASTRLGKDAIISEERIQAGAKLSNKLWNVARFSQRFFDDYQPGDSLPGLSLADRWILSRSQQLIDQVTTAFNRYDYATAKSHIELFFWSDLADNYLEMAKKRLYDEIDVLHEGAKYALYHAQLTTIKLLAPFLPHITEEIYLELYATTKTNASIHRSSWPVVDPRLADAESSLAGEVLVQIATAVRRYKSKAGIPLGTGMKGICLATDNIKLANQLKSAESDILSVTRADSVALLDLLSSDCRPIESDGPVSIGLLL